MRIFASTTYLGPGRTRISEALAGLCGLGLDGIELGSTHLPEADFAGKVRSLWKGPLLIHNYCPPAEPDLVVNLAAVIPGERVTSISYATSRLAFAREIGAPVYTVHPGFLAGATASAVAGANAYDFGFAEKRVAHEAAFGWMLEGLAILAEEAARLGVALAVETEGSVTNNGVLLLERPDEYERLFQAIPEGLGLTLNLAHSAFAAQVHGFDLRDFVARHRSRILAVEISHNDGHADQHRPLMAESPLLELVNELPDVPVVLEFRDAEPREVADSLRILRAAADRGAVERH